MKVDFNGGKTVGSGELESLYLTKRSKLGTGENESGKSIASVT